MLSRPSAAARLAVIFARGPISWPWAVSGQALATVLLALLLSALLFGLFPGLDLVVAGWFHTADDRFVGAVPLGEGLRKLFSWTPFAICAALLGLWAWRHFGPSGRGALSSGSSIASTSAAFAPRLWAPSTRGSIFAAVVLALGPGLFVNTILKDHWHRPRPVQVEAFGGTMPFRPFWRPDGACKRNCSFVSGEGATAFWTLAPALLVPPPVRAAAIGAAVLFGIATSVLRLAFGGHFLSDSVFAALFTWLFVIAIGKAIVPPEWRDSPAPPAEWPERDAARDLRARSPSARVR